jgi:NADPH:quinone reductase-like Zn-dependent oxidoreductase
VCVSSPKRERHPFFRTTLTHLPRSALGHARAFLLEQTAAAAPLVFWSALNSQPVAAEGKGDLVLVVGATGGIGQYAIFDLLSRGYKVRGITRRAEKVQGQVKGTELEKVSHEKNAVSKKGSELRRVG